MSWCPHCASYGPLVPAGAAGRGATGLERLCAQCASMALEYYCRRCGAMLPADVVPARGAGAVCSCERRCQ